MIEYGTAFTWTWSKVKLPTRLQISVMSSPYFLEDDTFKKIMKSALRHRNVCILNVFIISVSLFFRPNRFWKFEFLFHEENQYTNV